MQKIFSKPVSFFKSLKLTIALIIYAIFILLITSFIPLSPNNNFIFTFLVYIVPLLLFFLNLLTCTVIRFKKKKNNFLKIAPDIIHTGLIILIIGYFISSYFKETRFEYLKPGDTVSINNGYSLKLDSVSYISSESNKEWVSDIILMENSEAIKKQQIKANYPLTLGSINIYQYYSITSQIFLYLKDNKNNVYKIAQNEGFKIGDYYYIFSNAYDTDTIKAEFMVWDHEKQLENIVLTPGAKIEIFSIENIEIIYYSGLKIVKDPGVFIIFISFIIITIGIFLLLLKKLKK